MKKNSQSGFTLIELLVVIAIIGILASVVLASLNSARSKGADAAIKANLANARAQAELFYDSHASSYAGVCTSSNTDGIYAMILQAATTSNASANTIQPYGTAQPDGGHACHDQAGSWAASVALKSTPSSAYCVDSTGASRVITTELTNNATVCSAS